MSRNVSTRGARVAPAAVGERAPRGPRESPGTAMRAGGQRENGRDQIGYDAKSGRLSICLEIASNRQRWMRKHPIVTQFVRPLLSLSTGIYRSPWYCLAGVPSDAPCHSRHQKFTCTCCARSVHAGVVCMASRYLVACAAPMHSTLPECIWACAAMYRHVGALSGEVCGRLLLTWYAGYSRHPARPWRRMQVGWRCALTEGGAGGAAGT
jgi:hypothetical protein